MCYSAFGTALVIMTLCGGKWPAHFGFPSYHCMLPSGVMSLRNERWLPIPLSIFSLCSNQKHIDKHSFALPSVYVNPIHFGRSICSVYTGTKGPLWPLAGENHRRMSGPVHCILSEASARSQSSTSGLCLPARIGAWKTEKYIDLMPWAFPPACSPAKRLPVFTFRSIRAVNSSENTVIVAVVKRYVISFFVFVVFSSLFEMIENAWLGAGLS